MKYTLLLLLLGASGIFIRMFQLGANPSILNRDEAALAYNAYLLSETGTDEWGETWSVSLQSFGDYKLIGYPFILSWLFKILPENDLIVRLPSALAGIGILYLSYIISKKIFKEKFADLFSLLTISTTPVFIFYSKFAYEAHVALFFLVLSLYLLFFAKRSLLTDFVGIISSVMACLIYNTPLLLLPFLIVAIIFYRSPKKITTWLLPAFLLVISFIVIFSQVVVLTMQKSSITIFKDENLTLKAAEYYQSFPKIIQPLLGNKYVFFGGEMVKRFFGSFSPKFLVIEGGSHPWHTLPGWGNIFLPQYILGLLGIGAVILSITTSFFEIKTKQKLLKTIKVIRSQYKNELLLLYLLIVSLLPSIVTVDSPHTTRSLLFLFIFSLFSVYGMMHLTTNIKSNNINSGITYFIVISYVGLCSFYFYQYSVSYPLVHPKLYNSNFISAIQETDKNFSDKKVAIVDPSGYMYILTAWYLKVEPSMFFSTIKKQNPDTIGFRYGEQLKNYHFIADKKDITNMNENVLLYMNSDSGDWKIDTL